MLDSFTEEELENMDDLSYYKIKTESAISYFRNLSSNTFDVGDANNNLLFLIDGLGILEDPSFVPSENARTIITNVKIALNAIRHKVKEYEHACT